MFSKITKLNDYDKVTLIYEPTVQAKQQKSKVLTYLAVLVSIAIFLLGVNFAFHFLHFTNVLPPPHKHQQAKNDDNLIHPTTFENYNCSKKSFDYLQLTVRWPHLFVSNYEKCKKGAVMYNWSIHGLWPDFKNGSFPEFCCNNYKFDLDELKPIQSELETYWQDLKSENSSDHALWSHEWRKHGTCTMINSKLGTIFNYFNVTLALFKKYRVQTWLEEDDILPNKDESYKLDRIKKVIESRFNGKLIKVECDKYTHTKENCDKADYSDGQPKNCTKIKSKVYKLIDSIDLCFNKMTLEPIDCPANKTPRKIECGPRCLLF